MKEYLPGKWMSSDGRRWFLCSACGEFHERTRYPYPTALTTLRRMEREQRARNDRLDASDADKVL